MHYQGKDKRNSNLSRRFDLTNLTHDMTNDSKVKVTGMLSLADMTNDSKVTGDWSLRITSPRE